MDAANEFNPRRLLIFGFFLLPFFFFCFFFLGSLDRWIAESQVKIFSGDEGLEDVEASSHRS